MHTCLYVYLQEEHEHNQEGQSQELGVLLDEGHKDLHLLHTVILLGHLPKKGK